ncbi:unnamed protein product [Lasius platythorax]|uniref:Uncharacterized protein n=1 Tax=Lasius platythorax TaxID=488582 RepID=A0AAV2P8Q9_9HYME
MKSADDRAISRRSSIVWFRSAFGNEENDRSDNGESSIEAEKSPRIVDVATQSSALFRRIASIQIGAAL